MERGTSGTAGPTCKKGLRPGGGARSRLWIHNGRGWLFALGDAQLSAVLAAVHADIARRWTLEAMAKIAGMSRSSFAEKFKRIVGKSPLEHLIHWRMHVAADRLRTTGNNIASIAYEVGYESEAAFSTAFKRVNGYSPRGHRRLAG